jgi:hypothetical protein
VVLCVDEKSVLDGKVIGDCMPWLRHQDFISVYVASLFVHHCHGRRSHQDESAITRSYRIGRGAFFAKDVLGRDMKVTRAMYWYVQDS